MCALHLAKIHGTEEDKVNCPFYYKMGACRHGDRCSRIHHKPAFSPTLLMKHMYTNPQLLLSSSSISSNLNSQPSEAAIEDFVSFYEDMYLEFSKIGPIKELIVVDNLSDHMIGHVYIMYYNEEAAADAVSVMDGRYYDGRRITLEYSPVTDFREARCRAYEEGECDRGSVGCNFLHVKPIPALLVRSLAEEAEEDRRRSADHRHPTTDKKEHKKSSSTRSSSSSSKRHHKKEKEHKSSRKRHRSSPTSSSKDRSRDRKEDEGDDDDEDRSYTDNHSNRSDDDSYESNNNNSNNNRSD